MIDSEYLQKGAYYDELPDVYIFYISETDIWNGGKVAYKVSKTLNGQPYDDGIHTVYINAAVNDGSAIAAVCATLQQNAKSEGGFSIPVRVTIPHSRKCALQACLRVLLFSDFGCYHLSATYFKK